MQGTKKAQLAAALAATLGFALHGAATAADPSYGSSSTGMDTTKPTPIAEGSSTKGKSTTTTKSKSSSTTTKGTSSTCSSEKGKSSKCSSGKESSCSSKK